MSRNWRKYFSRKSFYTLTCQQILLIIETLYSLMLFNIAFYSQTNDQTKKQNQILKHYLRSYVNVEQLSRTKLLSLTEFVYNNFTHASANTSSFYLMYKYNSEIHYEVENNFIKERISSAKKWVKRFHDIQNQLIQRLQRVSKQ